MLDDPVSRLKMAREELNHVFGDGFAETHPEVLIAVIQSATSDYFAQLIAAALVDIAAALAEEQPQAFASSIPNLKPFR